MDDTFDLPIPTLCTEVGIRVVEELEENITPEVLSAAFKAMLLRWPGGLATMTEDHSGKNIRLILPLPKKETSDE